MIPLDGVLSYFVKTYLIKAKENTKSEVSSSHDYVLAQTRRSLFRPARCMGVGETREEDGMNPMGTYERIVVFIRVDFDRYW